VSVASDSSVDRPTIENHLYLRVVAERVAERLAQVQFGSRYDNDEGLRDLLFGDGGTRVTWHTQFLPGGDQAYSRPGNIREFFFCVQLASEPVRKLALIYHLLNLAMAAGDQLRYSVPRASCSAFTRTSRSSAEELREAIGPIWHYFGRSTPTDGAGAFPSELTVPFR
jgi:hypothetical protein